MQLTIKAGTMTSIELLAALNAARLEHGEAEIRRNDFTARCLDELEGEHYETFVVTNRNGTESTGLMLTRDQCALVLMRESKGVRRTVLAKLKGQQSELSRLEILKLAMDSEEARIKAEAALALAAPKVAVVDAYLQIHKGQLVGEVAKELAKEFQIGRQRLFDFMRDKGLIDARNQPYQKHVDAGRLYLQPGKRSDGDGGMVPTATLRVTPKGHFYLRELLTRADWPRSAAVAKEAA